MAAVNQAESLCRTVVAFQAHSASLLYLLCMMQYSGVARIDLVDSGWDFVCLLTCLLVDITSSRILNRSPNGLAHATLWTRRPLHPEAIA